MAEAGESSRLRFRQPSLLTVYNAACEAIRYRMVSRPEENSDASTPSQPSLARRRMGVVAATTLLWGTFVIGSDVLLPLWAAGDLGISADRWAHLRALRMVGVMVGILPLGVLAERYGARRLGPACMVLIAGVMVAWSFGEGAGLWVGMPLLGALVSASFVNLNTLTQRISDARQGLANSIYRGCFSATAIFAPILVTRLASVWSGYPPVLLVLAGILIASAAILFRYPGERPLGSA
ncbi:MAG: MFS transporter, partial [Armatimonadia bacterium]|nr:MFS transporter [Armatimonadia bacterium]